MILTVRGIRGVSPEEEKGYYWKDLRKARNERVRGDGVWSN